MDVLIRHSYWVEPVAEEDEVYIGRYEVATYLEFIDPIPRDATEAGAVLDFIEDNEQIDRLCIQDWKVNDGSPLI